jgi:hypothetical protein
VAALIWTIPAFASATTPVPDSEPPLPEPGSLGLRLVDAPAADDDPRAQVYIVDHLAPGTVIQRRIEVTNSTAVTTHISLYASAATIARGSFLGAARGTSNDLATWTSVSPGGYDIVAGGREMAIVTISVPSDAAPGEQYGVVWAETSSPPDTENGITEVSRVGIRLYVSVGPGGSPAADFLIDSLTATRSVDGRPTVLATVRNTGGRALDMAGTLQLSGGPAGLNAGPFPATLGTTLAIGDIETVTIMLETLLPAGPWDASIALHSGRLERTAHASITFPDAGQSTPSIATQTEQGRSYFATVAGSLGVLVGIAAVSTVLRQHRRRRARAHTSV